MKIKDLINELKRFEDNEEIFIFQYDKHSKEHIYDGNIEIKKDDVLFMF